MLHETNSSLINFERKIAMSRAARWCTANPGKCLRIKEKSMQKSPGSSPVTNCYSGKWGLLVLFSQYIASCCILVHVNLAELIPFGVAPDTWDFHLQWYLTIAPEPKSTSNSLVDWLSLFRWPQACPKLVSVTCFSFQNLLHQVVHKCLERNIVCEDRLRSLSSYSAIGAGRVSCWWIELR